jgi:putative transposase
MGGAAFAIPINMAAPMMGIAKSRSTHPTNRQTTNLHAKFFMTDYRRNRVAGGSYFFTVNLADRAATLLIDHIDLLRSAVRYTHERHPFIIDAMVVLPDHLHAVWTLPIDDADYETRWRLIKTMFSRGVPHNENRNQSRMNKGERGIWQRRYWEHTIRDDLDFSRHVDYVHINPVKHGYVTRVADWPHSSFHRYVKEGVLPSDWEGKKDGEIEEAGEPI